jgi:hypothetical protein
MTERVHFRPIVCIRFGEKEGEIDISDKPSSIKRHKTPNPRQRRAIQNHCRKVNKYYDGQKAQMVGFRVEEEQRDPIRGDSRLHKEMQVEQLLCQNAMGFHSTRVYRLSDEALFVLCCQLLSAARGRRRGRKG